MTPLDILPYYFALAPAPSDGRVAFALARPIADGEAVAVSVVLEDERLCTELFRFSRPGATQIAWSADGELLAFAVGTTLMVRQPAGKLHLTRLGAPVQWLGFDRDRRLWSLAGGRLEARLGVEIPIAIDDVDCVAGADLVAYLRRDGVGLLVCVHDGTSERVVARLPAASPVLGLSLAGTTLIVSLRPASVREHARLRIIRIDLLTARVDVVADEPVACGFNSAPGVAAMALSDGNVLAAYEREACSRVYALAAGASPTPISPAGFEVFDVVVDATGSRLAVVASDIRDPAGAAERQLLTARRRGRVWRFAPPRRGVHQLPRWRYDGSLEVLRGDTGSWTRQVYRAEDGAPAPAPSWCATFHVRGGDLEYDYLTLPGPGDRGAGIILLPRLHQQFVAGPQLFFFHQLLFGIARRLALDGYTVVVLGGPGGIGRGRVRREPVGSWFLALRSAIRDLADSLTVSGCGGVGLLAGSLAAVPALRLLGAGSPFGAAAFVAPLFEASIPVTEAVRYALLDDPAIDAVDDATAKLEVPVLVVHGARDEVVPLHQITRFCQVAGAAGLVERCLFEREGHIFLQPESWRRAQDAVDRFFAAHLP